MIVAEAAAKRRMNERTAKVINGHARTDGRRSPKELNLASLSKPNGTSVKPETTNNVEYPRARNSSSSKISSIAKVKRSYYVRHILTPYNMASLTCG